MTIVHCTMLKALKEWWEDYGEDHWEDLLDEIKVPFWYAKVYLYIGSFKLGFRKPPVISRDQLAKNWGLRFTTIYWNSHFNGQARMIRFTIQELTDFVWANEHVTLEERIILGLCDAGWRERAFGMHLLILFNLELGSELVLQVMEVHPEYIRSDDWHAHQLFFFYLVLNRSPKALAILEREKDVTLWPQDAESLRSLRYLNFKRTCLALALLPSHKDGFLSSNSEIRKLARTLDVYVTRAKILRLMPKPVVKYRIDDFSAATKARTSLRAVSDHEILRRREIALSNDI